MREKIAKWRKRLPVISIESVYQDIALWARPGNRAITRNVDIFSTCPHKRGLSIKAESLAIVPAKGFKPVILLFVKAVRIIYVIHYSVISA